MTTYIMAHIDVDGLVCHSIAEIWARKSGLTVKHCFVDYQDIGIALRTLSEKIKPDDKVLIADIGFEKELIDSFLNRYGEIAKRTSWFDHHKWAEEAVVRVSSIVEELVIDESLCASEILQKRFLPEGGLAKRLAQLARAHDFYGKGFEPKIFEQACKIQDVITSGYRKETVVEQLVSDILWSKDFETAYTQYQNIRPSAITRMDNTIAKYFVVVDGIAANIAIALTSGVLESKDVRAHLLRNENGSDAIIAIWPNGKIACEVRDEKFRAILEKINKKFNGGGRGLAVGAMYPQKINEKDYRECFDKIIEALRSD
ncbi:MAG: hypothetical protein WC520_01855 [Candidatus Paceibacterota bacterium]